MKKLTIIGNVTADAVVREVSNKKVINFTVAVNEKFLQNGVKVEKASFFKCAQWGDNTNIAQYIKKGDKIYVEGIPDIEMYDNKEGQKVANIKITVRQIELLGAKKAENGTPNTNGSTVAAPASTVAENNTLVPTPDDDLPF